MNGFQNLETLPPDPLLKLMSLYRSDNRADKVDLGVGVYRDNANQTPIFSAVKKTEALLLDREESKSYEGPFGNPRFCDSVANLISGDGQKRLFSESVKTTAPGGCGAIYMAMMLHRSLAPDGAVWVSAPSWPNHWAIAEGCGSRVKEYRYADGLDVRVDFDRLVSDLSALRRGDLVVLQGTCHNPTGIDFTPEQWVELASLIERQGAWALVDIAYHGFAHSLDENMVAVRNGVQGFSNAFISYSCSKNFGLYRERTGCLIVKLESSKFEKAVSSHLENIARRCYSMPPAHGAAIVETILTDDALESEWRLEVDEMRLRISDLRRRFSSVLMEVTGDDSFAAFNQQQGMFSRLPLDQAAAQELITQHGIYMPDSGRINIAGLCPESIPRVAELVGGLLSR